MEFLGIGGGRTGQAVKDVRRRPGAGRGRHRGRGRARQPGDPAGPEHPRPRHRRQGLVPLRRPGSPTHALASHPDPEAAVDAIVRQHIGLGAASGFVTSVGGFITLPLALPANVLGFYLIATRMTAAIAKVRGYDLRQEEIRTAVLLTLVGADADDLLKKAGMASPGGTL